MKYFTLFRNASAWIAAVILASLPILLAADFGGMLWWTQYLGGFAVLAAALLTLPTAFSSERVASPRCYYLVAILLLWTAFAWLQTVPMFGGLVAFLSNGSKVAYSDWLAPFVGSADAPTSFPISLAPEQSAHAVALLALVVCAVWSAGHVFVSRAKHGMLLNVLAIGAALHAVFGIARQAYPAIEVFGVAMPESSFGAFVNRNNAALMMNIGLGSSLALLAWRLSALTGLEVDDKNFEFNDLLSLTGDRSSLVGLSCASLCLCGLLICGSRGGLVAFLVGSLLALGWVRQRRGMKTIPVVSAIVIASALLLLVPLKLDFKSIQRFEFFDAESTSTLLNDGRLGHWPSALRAAEAHFPAGSGLGSYAYAYLPHQDQGSDKWFHHADNLWLEMLVEQGLPGLLLTIAVLLVWIRTLLLMTESADPIDHGLRVSGWFVLGAVGTSQIFDFGLILPSILLAVAVYVAALIARVDAAGLNVNLGKLSVFSPKYSTYGYASLSIVVLFLAGLAMFRLRSDAELESLSKHVAATLPSVQKDAGSLAELAGQLRESPNLQHSPELLDWLSKVQYAQVRLVETKAQNPATVQAVQAAYDRTGIMAKRAAWYARNTSGPSDVSSPSVSESANQLYQSILESADTSLRQLPLSFDPRTWQVYLDFVHQDAARSQQAVKQLAKMYTGNPIMLERLGTHAATAGDTESATQLWRQVLILRPQRALKILELVRQRDDIDLLAVLPSERKVFRRVTRRMINLGIADEALLTRAADEIDCANAETKKEKSECHRLASDIAYGLGNQEKAIEELRTAIELTPTQLALHLAYVKQLRENDRREEARAAARRARLLFPDDKRFQRIIVEMADEDTRAIEELPDNPLLFEFDDQE